jgi:universal stress protein E
MSRKRRGSIMVGVQAVDSSSSQLLRKAANLARARKCSVHLVHVIALPYAAAVSRRASVRQAARDILQHSKKQLLKLAAGPLLRGLQTRSMVIWDYPAADGLVRHVLKHRPQLLLVESQRRARLKRRFLTNTDWELIRKCPCLLWLSKSTHSKVGGTVVAALDPLHARAKPAALDALILEQAVEITGQPKHVLACHAYTLPSRPPTFDGAFDTHWVGQELELYESKVRAELSRLADRFGVPERNRILAVGNPVSVLPRVVRSHNASLVIMGAVSRGAIRRMFIGHTAERVIDLLDCDVLVVKPRGFKTSVASRHGAIVDG